MSCWNYVTIEETHTEYRGDTLYTYVTTYQQCQVIGDSGIPEYCDSGGCRYCPRLGGDDRYRRPDALTEYMSDEIARQVRESIRAASVALRDLVWQVQSDIAATNYEPLRVCYYDAGYRKLNTPFISGAYDAIVSSLMERNQAAELERRIQWELDSFRIGELMPDLYRNSEPFDISSRDFDRLYDTLGRDGSVMTALNTRISPGGFASLGTPAMKVLEDLADQVAAWLRYFRQTIMDVQRQFESGVRRSTDGAAFFGSSYSGPVPDWYRGI